MERGRIVVSVSQNTHHHRPLMVQAPVRALDPDGVAVVTAGTVAFAIGALVCWWFAPTLAATGKLWYLWVSVLGTVIGLLGIAFGLFRKSRRNRGRRVPAGDEAPMRVERLTEPAQPAGAAAPATEEPTPRS